jgi:hypothetical protein
MMLRRPRRINSAIRESAQITGSISSVVFGFVCRDARQILNECADYASILLPKLQKPQATQIRKVQLSHSLPMWGRTSVAGLPGDFVAV